MAGWDVLNEEDGSGTLLRTRFGGLAGQRCRKLRRHGILGVLCLVPVEDPPQEVTLTGHTWVAGARLYYTAYRYYGADSIHLLRREPQDIVRRNECVVVCGEGFQFGKSEIRICEGTSVAMTPRNI